jgi:hypothetical protein
MAGKTPFILTKASQEGINKWLSTALSLMVQSWNMREQMKYIDATYQREGDYTPENLKARLAARLGDKKRLANITVPVVMPQVESALAYLSGVFLSGHPIFGMVSDPANEDAALQFEAIIEENSRRGSWIREYILWLRDGLKYNIHCMEVVWDKKTIFQPITDTSYDAKIAKPTQVIWEGNCCRRIDMYNAFFDTRVEPARIHKEGEFAGYTDMMSRMKLKQFIQDLGDDVIKDNIGAAFNSGLDTGQYTYYYTPLINPDALITTDSIVAGFDWMSWATDNAKEGRLRYNSMYMVTTTYGRIIPSDFSISVPARNTPQIWKFIHVNNQVCIYAERQTDAHNNLPMIFGQPIEDGLRHQTKSFAVNGIPFQDMASALWNAKLASERRKVGDRVLYNPLLIDEKNINSDNPSAKIPVRPAAYGRNLAEAVYQFPYRDDSSNSLLSEAGQVVQFGNLVAGQNPAQQGQFVKGNKTLHEFQTVMNNSNNREQMMALFIEAQSMTEIKETLKLNMLQYQPAGTIYSPSQKKAVAIDPIRLRQAQTVFKVTDGMLPLDKIIESDFLGTMMQVISQDPELSLDYNKAKIFSYFAKLRGMHDLNQFETTDEEKKMILKNREQQMQMQAQNTAAVKAKSQGQGA